MRRNGFSTYPFASPSAVRTDSYIEQGVLGQRVLADYCHSWAEVSRLAAEELWRCGEAESARLVLKSRKWTVREYLRWRFGVATGRREYFTPSYLTADRADLREFLAALRDARR